MPKLPNYCLITLAILFAYSAIALDTQPGSTKQIFDRLAQAFDEGHPFTKDSLSLPRTYSCQLFGGLTSGVLEIGKFSLVLFEESSGSCVGRIIKYEKKKNFRVFLWEGAMTFVGEKNGGKYSLVREKNSENLVLEILFPKQPRFLASCT